MSISKENGIGEVVSKYPETTEVFFRHGMGCLDCAIAQFESIEEGAAVHGIDIGQLVRDLNAAIGH